MAMVFHGFVTMGPRVPSLLTVRVLKRDDRFPQAMGKIGGKKKHYRCTMVYLFTFESYKNRCSSQTIQKIQEFKLLKVPICFKTSGTWASFACFVPSLVLAGLPYWTPAFKDIWLFADLVNQVNQLSVVVFPQLMLNTWFNMFLYLDLLAVLFTFLPYRIFNMKINHPGVHRNGKMHRPQGRLETESTLGSSASKEKNDRII